MLKNLGIFSSPQERDAMQIARPTSAAEGTDQIQTYLHLGREEVYDANLPGHLPTSPPARKTVWDDVCCRVSALFIDLADDFVPKNGLVRKLIRMA